MGWNTVSHARDHPLWHNIDNNERFYFVHSYYVESTAMNQVFGLCEYGNRFTAAAGKENLFAVQFHPEKSQQAGLKLLENFLKLERGCIAMLLIPAIDIKDGKCVRLKQGDMNQETVFSDDPVAVAQRWVDAGARRIHIVDLDGATKGEPVNADIIHRIVETHPDVPVQVGGGIRSEDTVDIYIQAGVRYVIIGTQAINEPPPDQRPVRRISYPM